MTGSFKHLATENGPGQSSSEDANAQSIKLRQQPLQLPSCQGGVPEGRGGCLFIFFYGRARIGVRMGGWA
jgi:hypothetical protein